LCSELKNFDFLLMKFVEPFQDQLSLFATNYLSSDLLLGCVKCFYRKEKKKHYKLGKLERNKLERNITN